MAGSGHTPSSKKPNRMAFIIRAVLIVAFIIIFLSLLFAFRRKLMHFMRQRLKRATDEPADHEKGSKFPVSESIQSATYPISYFDYGVLKKATRDFHEGNKLGQGGFGPVYKGTLPDGTNVAIKKLSAGKSKQGDAEFLSEVKLITSIQHKNLVRLLGSCSEGSERLLVYEYMPNRSLDRVLYGKTNEFLNWRTRYEIIVGIARGLQYLHEDSYVRIIHRDIKASNILLDKKFRPKIADFGVARFFPEDQAYLSTTFAGTLGYTAPEYATRGELSEKVDIYSYGVLVLEIVSGRTNTDLDLPSDMQYLPELAWRLYETNRILELVDPRIQGDGYDTQQVLRVIQVAFLCTQAPPSLRPRMSHIVAMLFCGAEMLMTPMKPAYMQNTHRYNELPTWDSITDNFPSSSPDEHSSTVESLNNVLKV